MGAARNGDSTDTKPKRDGGFGRVGLGDSHHARVKPASKQIVKRLSAGVAEGRPGSLAEALSGRGEQRPKEATTPGSGPGRSTTVEHRHQKPRTLGQVESKRT